MSGGRPAGTGLFAGLCLVAVVAGPLALKAPDAGWSTVLGMTCGACATAACAMSMGDGR